jgi:hypothetical protein
MYARFKSVNLNFFSGQLLDHIKNQIKFTELEASFVIRDLAMALQFLHKKGIKVKTVRGV